MILGAFVVVFHYRGMAPVTMHNLRFVQLLHYFVFPTKLLLTCLCSSFYFTFLVREKQTTQCYIYFFRDKSRFCIHLELLSWRLSTEILGFPPLVSRREITRGGDRYPDFPCISTQGFPPNLKRDINRGIHRGGGGIKGYGLIIPHIEYLD